MAISFDRSRGSALPSATASPAPLLLTGGSGRLGRALQTLVFAGGPGAARLVAPSRALLDVTCPDSVRRALDRHRPALVIHAAAVVGWREAERDRARTWAVNVTGTGVVVAACRESGVGLLHVSSPAVFDGVQGLYREEDPPCPAYYYGETKRAAEELALSLPDALVVRLDFFDPAEPFKHAALLGDHFCSKLPVAEAARRVLLAVQLGARGLLHVGGPRVALARLLRPYWPDLPETPIARSPLPDFPRDLSLSTARFDRLVGATASPAPEVLP